MSNTMFHKCKKWLRHFHHQKRHEKQEKVKDLIYEEYYSRFALAHLNKVITSFGRPPQASLGNAMWYAKHIGILQPFADDVLYMQNMKKASFMDI